MRKREAMTLLFDKILDVIGDNHMAGWCYHSEDACYVYIKHSSKKKPVCRIRKDTGAIQMLDKMQFYDNGKPIGYILTAEKFLELLTNSK